MRKVILLFSLLITVINCAPSEKDEIVSVKMALDKELLQLYDAYQVEKSIHDQSMEECENEINKIRKKQEILNESIEQDRKTRKNLTRPEVVYPESYLTERISEEIQFQQKVHKKISECKEKYEKNCNLKYQHELSLSAELIKLFQEKNYVNNEFWLSYNLLSMDIDDSLNEFDNNNKEIVIFFENKSQLENLFFKKAYQYKKNSASAIQTTDDKLIEIVSKDLEWRYWNKTLGSLPSNSVAYDNEAVIIREIINGVLHYGKYSHLNNLAIVYGQQDVFEPQQFEVRSFKFSNFTFKVLFPSDFDL